MPEPAGSTQGANRRLGRAGLLLLLLAFLPAGRADTVELPPADSPAGYLARLLINETPFPGERFWTSEEDTGAAQSAIIWVLRHRLRDIPPGYTQRQVAAITTDNVIDLLTAGGEHGQVEGFYRDAAGRPVMTARVTERVDYLVTVANRGTPGRFARLLLNARRLAEEFVGTTPRDHFAAIERIGEVPVTGGAYGWMTDREIFRPGGNFVRITDDWRGGLGGNRFFTLRRLPR